MEIPKVSKSHLLLKNPVAGHTRCSIFSQNISKVELIISSFWKPNPWTSNHDVVQGFTSSWSTCCQLVCVNYTFLKPIAAHMMKPPAKKCALPVLRSISCLLIFMTKTLSLFVGWEICFNDFIALCLCSADEVKKIKTFEFHSWTQTSTAAKKCQTISNLVGCVPLLRFG